MDLLGVLKSIGGLCVSRDMGMLVCPVCGVCVRDGKKNKLDALQIYIVKTIFPHTWDRYVLEFLCVGKF